MAEPISTIVLLGIACLIFRSKHKNWKEKRREEGDSYIILSELDQDQGRHEENDEGESIYEGDFTEGEW